EFRRVLFRSNAALPPNRVVSDNRNAEGPVRGQARYAEALARRRVPVGFAFAALVLWLSRPTFSTLGIGTAIAIVGETIRVWAAGHLNKSREVTTSGPYRWSAHPLYVGSTVIGIGLGVASSSLAAVALIAAYLTATLAAAMKTEEAFLRPSSAGCESRSPWRKRS